MPAAARRERARSVCEVVPRVPKALGLPPSPDWRREERWVCWGCGNVRSAAVRWGWEVGNREAFRLGFGCWLVLFAKREFEKALDCCCC